MFGHSKLKSFLHQGGGKKHTKNKNSQLGITSASFCYTYVVKSNKNLVVTVLSAISGRPLQIYKGIKATRKKKNKREKKKVSKNVLKSSQLYKLCAARVLYPVCTVKSSVCSVATLAQHADRLLRPGRAVRRRPSSAPLCGLFYFIFFTREDLHAFHSKLDTATPLTSPLTSRFFMSVFHF